MKIAIIGAGPAGIITAIAICNKIKSKFLSIDIYDPETPFRGRSFNTYSDYMLLNTSVGVSFIDPDAPYDFMNYINSQGKLQIKAGEVVPRDLAVSFLQSELELAKKNIGGIDFFRKNINDISINKSGGICIHYEKQSKNYDGAVIATGLQFSPPPDIFYHHNIMSPYPAQRLTEIDQNSAVLVLGSRLSAIDTLVHLSKTGHKGPIDVFSHSQLFPSVRRHVIKARERNFFERYKSAVDPLPNDYSRISCFLNIFKDYLINKNIQLTDIIATHERRGRTQLEHDIRNCQDNRNVWEDILMDVIDGLNYIWPSLTSEDKRRFNKEVNPWFVRIAHSMPLCNALIISNLFHKNQLNMLSLDELLTADINNYKAVINATGLQSAENDILLLRLSKRNLLLFNGNGGVRVDVSTHRLRTDLPVYANGSIVQGEVFTANSIYSTSYGAKKIALDIEKLSKKITP